MTRTELGWVELNEALAAIALRIPENLGLLARLHFGQLPGEMIGVYNSGIDPLNAEFRITSSPSVTDHTCIQLDTMSCH